VHWALLCVFFTRVSPLASSLCPGRWSTRAARLRAAFLTRHLHEWHLAVTAARQLRAAFLRRHLRAWRRYVVIVRLEMYALPRVRLRVAFRRPVPLRPSVCRTAAYTSKLLEMEKADRGHVASNGGTIACLAQMGTARRLTSVCCGHSRLGTAQVGPVSQCPHRTAYPRRSRLRLFRGSLLRAPREHGLRSMAPCARHQPASHEAGRMCCPRPLHSA